MTFLIAGLISGMSLLACIIWIFKEKLILIAINKNTKSFLSIQEFSIMLKAVVKNNGSLPNFDKERLEYISTEIDNLIAILKGE